MTAESFPDSMQRLVEKLKTSGIISDTRVESTMLKVDRAYYNPSKYPYLDEPFQIGFGATISAPHMHAYALEALKDKLVDGAKVLDVGSGSGYMTACMAHMIGPKGVAYGVEHIKELVSKSVENMNKDCSELIESGRVKIVQSDGRVGLDEYAPYDAIHVGACADGLPEKLVQQLKIGGRMVLPVERGPHQIFESVDKLPSGDLKQTELLRVNYVRLTDVRSQLKK